jgi:hypothetical protein
MNKKVVSLIVTFLVLLSCSPAIISAETEIPIEIAFQSADSLPISLDGLLKQVEEQVLTRYPEAELASMSIEGQCENTLPVQGEYTFFYKEKYKMESENFRRATRYITVVLNPANESVKMTSEVIAYEQESLPIPIPSVRQIEKVFEYISLESQYYTDACKYSLSVSGRGSESYPRHYWVITIRGETLEERPEMITVYFVVEQETDQ